MEHLKTSNCIICGDEAIVWHGHVIAKEKMALGNYIDKKITAGFCAKHDNKRSKANGYFCDYNSNIMGKCIPLFDFRKDN